jgi:hypothetical protein
MEFVWMLLALIGFAEIAVVIRIKGLLKQLAEEARAVKLESTVVGRQAKRVGAIISILEERMAAFERATRVMEKGEGERDEQGELPAGLADETTAG